MSSRPTHAQLDRRYGFAPTHRFAITVDPSKCKWLQDRAAQAEIERIAQEFTREMLERHSHRAAVERKWRHDADVAGVK